MKELVFIVEESQDVGFFAKALGTSIVTQGDTVNELKSVIRDAVKCHFEPSEIPGIIHLHVTREETFAL